MDLSNPSNWSLRYVQSFTSDYIRGLGLPIPVFDTDTLSDRLLRVRVTSSTAKDTWTYAGRATQVIDAGGVDTDLDSLYMKLNVSLLWQLQDFGSYRLRVAFPKYFTQATISIFGYTGSL
ncbi:MULTISPECIES: hypothetical protein [Pseudanabaena]|uniref:Uncharacterized protein n=2 Tax=Pseudanabaena TaxID=1152 RepID=L8MXR7_9CYAN|nr:MULTISPECIES: hypothetical protein [Pseudanabaena]ELS32792.1 hypothetical protein Pse7429DRAFT_1997 [Pseudanabaena biceps PCC 7429]MDG3494978.1 hypothetical protein [Pseudanabaena catenata USMAC16]